MKNHVSKSELITITAPVDLKSGVPVFIGSFLGVPVCDTPQNELASVYTEGVVSLILSSNARLGDVLYLKSDGSLINTAEEGNKAIGYALDTAISGSEIRVMLQKGLS